MTRYEVLLSETAKKQLKKLPIDLKEHIKDKLAQLYEDPYYSRPKADIKKLKGPDRDYYRLRIGDYRAIYVVEAHNVKVAKVLHRSKAYEWID
ncbi:MAG: type II toxin-antitoxin system RelE family toxin [Candidatus Saliniplasma sp.]